MIVLPISMPRKSNFSFYFLLLRSSQLLLLFFNAGSLNVKAATASASAQQQVAEASARNCGVEPRHRLLLLFFEGLVFMF